jgi:apolipoprotein N-acyltransferase
MNCHGTTAGACCFVTVIGVLLAIAFASPPVMVLAFFAFLLAVWVTVPAPVADDDWVVAEAERITERAAR